MHSPVLRPSWPRCSRELPPTSDVIFFEGKVSPANPFLKVIAGANDGQARVREFAPLRRDALAAWVSERAAQKGANDRPAHGCRCSQSRSGRTSG